MQGYFASFGGLGMGYDAKLFSVQNSKEEHQIEKHLHIMDVLTS